jgi:hypothetical protein
MDEDGVHPRLAEFRDDDGSLEKLSRAPAHHD